MATLLNIIITCVGMPCNLIKRSVRLLAKTCLVSTFIRHHTVKRNTSHKIKPNPTLIVVTDTYEMGNIAYQKSRHLLTKLPINNLDVQYNKLK